MANLFMKIVKEASVNGKVCSVMMLKILVLINSYSALQVFSDTDIFPKPRDKYTIYKINST